MNWTHIKTIIHIDKPFKHDFYIEMCNDFAFLDRQKRITIDGRDYYIDREEFVIISGKDVRTINKHIGKSILFELETGASSAVIRRKHA